MKNAGRSRGSFGSAFWVEDEKKSRVHEAVSLRRRFGFNAGDRLDLVYRPKLNLWDGIETIDLFLEDIKLLS